MELTLGLIMTLVAVGAVVGSFRLMTLFAVTGWPQWSALLVPWVTGAAIIGGWCLLDDVVVDPHKNLHGWRVLVVGVITLGAGLININGWMRWLGWLLVTLATVGLGWLYVGHYGETARLEQLAKIGQIFAIVGPLAFILCAASIAVGGTITRGPVRRLRHVITILVACGAMAFCLLTAANARATILLAAVVAAAVGLAVADAVAQRRLRTSSGGPTTGTTVVFFGACMVIMIGATISAAETPPLLCLWLFAAAPWLALIGWLAWSGRRPWLSTALIGAVVAVVIAGAVVGPLVMGKAHAAESAGNDYYR